MQIHIQKIKKNKKGKITATGHRFENQQRIKKLKKKKQLGRYFIYRGVGRLKWWGLHKFILFYCFLFILRVCQYEKFNTH